MLFARDRHSTRESALLSAPASDGILLRALTDSWAIWSEGRDDTGADWTLRASRLPDAHGATAAPLTLARNANNSGDSAPAAPTRLTGIWAQGQTVLLTALTRGGSSELLRFDLSERTPAARVIARASQSGRLLASPCKANGSYYWSEAWIGQDARLHSTIWRGDDAGHAQPLANDDAAFAPQTAVNALLWIEDAGGADAAGARPGDLGGIARALSAAQGDLEARSLSGGNPWRVSADAEVTSLQAAGPFLLWRAGNIEHSYDLGTRAATAADAQLREAPFAGADETTLAWGEPSGAIAVLDR